MKISILILLICFSLLGQDMNIKIQRAGYDFEQYDNLGAVSYEKFISEFNSYPWSSEVGTANGKCEPTISVEDNENYSIFWVSVIGDSSDYAYLVGRNYLKDTKKYYFFGSAVQTKWVEAIVTEDPQRVLSLFKLYFDRNFENIEAVFNSEHKFLSNKAP